MQFLMMIYLEEQRWETFTENAATASVMQRQLWSWYEERVRNGTIVEAGRLRDSSTATTLRNADGRPMITDGPFAETKEVLGGFHLLECKDRAEAIAVAKTFPGLDVDGVCIELRPVMTTEEETRRWR